MGKVESVVLGIAVGFVAGILLAPDSGDETRQHLKRKARVVRDRAAEGYGVVLRGAKRGSNALKDVTEETVESLKDTARETKAEVTGR